MRTSQRRNVTDRRIVGRLRPFFDRLEARTALSGTPIDPGQFGLPNPFDPPAETSPLSIASTTPSNSSTLTSSPTSLSVTFNKPLNGFSIGIEDFELVSVNSDGTPLATQSSPILPSESLDFSNPSDNQIDLTLSHPLVAGHYQLILLGSNQLAGADGSQVVDHGQDEIISEFAIAPTVTGFQDATNLQTVGSTIVTTVGTLNLAQDPGAVNYAKLTLAPGHHWSLGLAVNSQGGSSGLATSLSLFDSQGKLIATDTTGLANDPGDPFLFEGLDPGTYYVGISARGNVPQADGTYDPTSSFPAGSTSELVEGSYQLQAVANVADQPIQVLGARLDQADPNSTSPTGMTLQFSGALQVATLEYQTSPPLKLVDQDGTSWGVTTVGYDPSLGQLQVVFNQALPPGSYTLELTSPTSLLDLADEVPVASGLGSDQLAKFRVNPVGPLPAADLGPIYPGDGSSQLVAGVAVAPESTTTRQFVIIEPGVYSVAGASLSTSFTYTLQDASGTQKASGPSRSRSGSSDVTLQLGIYTLTFSNNSQQTINIALTILHKESLFSQLMDGAIAQGAALSLRLVTPQANFGAVNNLTFATTSGSSSVTASPAVPTSSASITATTSSNPGVEIATATGPSAVALLYGFGPVGLPTSQTNQISVVGSTSPSGALALASNSPGLSPGLIGIPDSRLRNEVPESANGLTDEAVDFHSRPETPRVSSTDTGLLARSPQSRRADDQSLAGAEWISRLVFNTLNWFGERTVVSQEPVIEPQITPTLAFTPVTAPVPVENGPDVDQASLGSPIGVTAVLVGIAYHYRKRLLGRGSHRKAGSQKIHVTKRLEFTTKNHLSRAGQSVY